MPNPLRRGVASSQVSDWLGDNNLGIPANKSKAFATGGTESDITVSGVVYRLHQFTTSGNFVVEYGPLEVEFLVVGGGGSGGTTINRATGGGGAGGVIHNLGGDRCVLATGSYTVTVGAGGVAPATGANAFGVRGNTSALGFINAPGGGGGASSIGTVIGDAGEGGGSGGGGGTQTANYQALGGDSIFPFGNPGGKGKGSTTSTEQTAGGGGGAGAAGADGTITDAGDGGDGVELTITGTAVYYGGGGGGGRRETIGGEAGTGGLGGGGNGGRNNVGVTSGTDGLGGGGGGNGSSSGAKGGDGGDGIVIIRWAV